MRPAGLVNTGDTKFATLVEIFEILEGFKRDKANRSADKVKWVQHLITVRANPAPAPLTARVSVVMAKQGGARSVPSREAAAPRGKSCCCLLRWRVWTDLTTRGQRDTERKMFFLKESKLAKAYVSALSLGRTAEDRHALENWKEPNEHIVSLVARL